MVVPKQATEPQATVDWATSGVVGSNMIDRSSKP